MAEPTSALTFSDLILYVSERIGTTFFGTDGTGVAQIPTDARDLAQTKDIVNNAIRMTIDDAPPMGWRWLKPTSSLIVWADVAVVATVTATGVVSAGVTTITASTASFHPSMERKTMSVTGETDFALVTYVSTTVMTVDSDVAWAGSKTFAISSGGAFTLPQNFGGMLSNTLTFAADSGQITFIDLTDEFRIRELNQGSSSTGPASLAAIRHMLDVNRRWELVLWPTPDKQYTILYRYEIYFDKLTATTEVHPAGYRMDETIKAACLSVIERDIWDNPNGPYLQDYRGRVLQNAYRRDRQSGSRTLGYMHTTQRDSLLVNSNLRPVRNNRTVTFT